MTRDQGAQGAQRVQERIFNFLQKYDCIQYSGTPWRKLFLLSRMRLSHSFNFESALNISMYQDQITKLRLNSMSSSVAKCGMLLLITEGSCMNEPKRRS